MNLKKILALASSLVMMCTAFSGCDEEKSEGEGKSAAAVSYNWSNVAIGGGGYVTGMEYSKVEDGLVYARTDIGGAYRWVDKESKWVAITDHLGSDEWNLIGIESICADPVDANRVYIACGTYMETANGAILSSDDYGKTWTRFDLPFGCGGNQSGRGVGERLAVDPKDNKNVYFGSRTDGMWKSTDHGKTWAKVESFPTEGNFVQESNAIGIMWIEFAPDTNDIYAGVAETNGTCIYKSADGGATWNALPALQAGMYPLQADISKNGKMYIACSNNCGPNESPTEGMVLAYDLAAGTFTDITPALDDSRYGGFSGVSVDAQNPDTVVISTVGFWSNYGDNIYRTTDGGATWTPFFDNKSKNYVMDVTEADWLNWGLNEAKLGWWTSDINIDPFNSDEVMYGTGATIYATTNMTALGTGTPVTVKFHAYGLEETAVFEMISPPAGGPQLYSIMGDLTGFSHVDVTKCPDEAHFMADGKPSDIDCAWLNPNIAVMCGDMRNSLRYTTDGVTWNHCKALPESAQDGKVAMSADGKSFIWTPASSANKPFITPDYGTTWYNVNGLGYGSTIVADRVNPLKFYAVCDSMFYVSTDGGYNFTPTTAVMEGAGIAAVGDKEGDVWVYNEGLMMHTEDGGQTFEPIKNFKCRAMGFGAPKKEGDYMVIYAMGSTEESGDGIYRSEDKGKTWQRINDEHHLFGNLTLSITGDSEIYGRVYFATNGRGIVMGDIAE